MNADLCLLPSELATDRLTGRTAVVFDVLRATSSMAAALAAGVKEIRIFGDIAAASAAHANFTGPRLLCGEVNALAPAGFDLGNSPGAFGLIDRTGVTVFISTTNGTRAILASQTAEILLIGAIVNASATAQAVFDAGRDVTLVCAGTNGQVAMEDLIGCGAVLDALGRLTAVHFQSDQSLLAHRLFCSARGDLAGVLRETRGGKNVIAAGLDDDINFCSKLDSLNIVGRASGSPPTIRRLVTA